MSYIRPPKRPSKRDRLQSEVVSERESSFSDHNGHEQPSLSPLPDSLDLANREAVAKFVQEEAKRISDVRQERLEKIRSEIEAGTYEVSSEDIARGIIRDSSLGSDPNRTR